MYTLPLGTYRASAAVLFLVERWHSVVEPRESALTEKSLDEKKFLRAT